MATHLDASPRSLNTHRVKTITASELETQLFVILDAVERTGEAVVVTRHGREVARLIGPTASTAAHPQGELRDNVTFLGDVLAPTRAPEDWATLGS